MKIAVLLSTLSALVALPHVGVADGFTHESYMRSVAIHAPLAGFNHVVGDTRFVGYFQALPGRCHVTVFKAGAEGEKLVVAPVKLDLMIAAGDRAELKVSHGEALAIACTVDADAIAIAPQYALQNHAARL
jgi:hypothetical protein